MSDDKLVVTVQLFRPGEARPWLVGELAPMGHTSVSLADLKQLWEIERAVNATVPGRLHIDVTGGLK